MQEEHNSAGEIAAPGSGGSLADASTRIWTIPNLLSFLRLLGVPLFLWLLLTHPPHDGWALVVLAVSAVTDWADGKLARLLGQYSKLGELLDPAADRLYIFATLVAFVIRGFIPWWVAALIIGRDLVLAVGLRIVRRHGYQALPVHYLGKAATFCLLYAFPPAVAGPGRLLDRPGRAAVRHRVHRVGDAALPVGRGAVRRPGALGDPVDAARSASPSGRTWLIPRSTGNRSSPTKPAARRRPSGIRFRCWNRWSATISTPGIRPRRTGGPRPGPAVQPVRLRFDLVDDRRPWSTWPVAWPWSGWCSGSPRRPRRTRRPGPTKRDQVCWWTSTTPSASSRRSCSRSRRSRRRSARRRLRSAPEARCRRSAGWRPRADRRW